VIINLLEKVYVDPIDYAENAIDNAAK
jgi:hypothetical protein